MSDWFYRLSNAEENGPIKPSELLELIRKGVICEKTQLRKGDSPWVASTSINGLWEAAGRPSAEFECPNCGKSIPKPPVECTNCHQLIRKATGRLVHHKNVVPPPKNASGKEAESNTTRFNARPGLYD